MIELELERKKMKSQVHKVILFISMCGIVTIIIYDKQMLIKIFKYPYLGGLTYGHPIWNIIGVYTMPGKLVK